MRLCPWFHGLILSKNIKTLTTYLSLALSKISGLPCRVSASSTASRQKSTFMVIETRHDSTRRMNQSSTAVSPSYAPAAGFFTGGYGAKV